MSSTNMSDHYHARSFSRRHAYDGGFSMQPNRGRALDTTLETSNLKRQHSTDQRESTDDVSNQDTYSYTYRHPSYLSLSCRIPHPSAYFNLDDGKEIDRCTRVSCTDPMAVARLERVQRDAGWRDYGSRSSYCWSSCCRGDDWNSCCNNPEDRICRYGSRCDNDSATLFMSGRLECREGAISDEFLVTSSRLTNTIVRRNERERNRVKTINHTFAKLRQHLPGGSAFKPPSAILFSSPPAAANRRGSAARAVTKNQSTKREGRVKKLSKVETLRSAISYINQLRRVLQDHPAVGDETVDDEQGGKEGTREKIKEDDDDDDDSEGWNDDTKTETDDGEEETEMVLEVVDHEPEIHDVIANGLSELEVDNVITGSEPGSPSSRLDPVNINLQVISNESLLQKCLHSSRPTGSYDSREISHDVISTSVHCLRRDSAFPSFSQLAFNRHSRLGGKTFAAYGIHSYERA